MRLPRAAASFLAVMLLLSACGGGGGGGDGGGTTEPPGRSQTQEAFEDLTLASQGGAHQLVLAQSVDGRGRPTLTWLAAGSSSMNRSPAGRTNGGRLTPAPLELLLLAGPGSQPVLDFSNKVGQAVIAEGAIHFIQNNDDSIVLYEGDDVLVEARSTDGVYARRERVTAMERVPLRGRVAAAPAEFKAVFAALLPHLDPSIVFPEGAAYYKRSVLREGELLAIQDFDGRPETDKQSATPLMVGRIENIPNIFTSVDLAQGQIRTVQGARCWVRNQPNRDLVGNPLLSSIAPSHSVLCEVEGKVYAGNLQPDGAALGALQPAAGNLEAVPYSIRLNQAAMDGIRAMLP